MRVRYHGHIPLGLEKIQDGGKTALTGLDNGTAAVDAEAEHVRKRIPRIGERDVQVGPVDAVTVVLAEMTPP